MKKAIVLFIFVLTVLLCCSSCDTAVESPDDPAAQDTASCDHVWRSATCDAPQMCRICEEIVGEPLGHDWAEATCDSAKRCRNCRETEGSELGHQWDGEILCTDPAVCTVCQATSGSVREHEWKEETCEDPRRCENCSATQGEALGHDWRGGSCNSLAVCSYCDKEAEEFSPHEWSGGYCEEANSCYHCGEIKEGPLGHAWEEATCTTPKRCTRCRESIGNPLRHNYDYKENICLVCDEAMVSTISDLRDWLFRDFQEIETAIGTLKLTGSQMVVTPYFASDPIRTHDYDVVFESSIYIQGVNMTLMEAVVKAEHIPYEDRIQAVIDVLKAQMKIAELVTKVFPDKKFEIKFFSEGYEIPIFGIGYFSDTQLSWRNFTPNQSGMSGYDSTDLCDWYIDNEGFLNSVSCEEYVRDIVVAWQEYDYELRF